MYYPGDRRLTFRERLCAFLGGHLPEDVEIAMSRTNLIDHHVNNNRWIKLSNNNGYLHAEVQPTKEAE